MAVLSRQSRAVTRPIEGGNAVVCASCGQPIKFNAKVRRYQVIANVYIKRRWSRVEHYHAECYEGAGRPYGSAA